MHPGRLNRWSYLVLVALVGQWGCQSSDLAVPNAKSDQPAAIAVVEPHQVNLADASVEQTAASDESLKLDEDSTRRMASETFEPPYPDRLDMFMPPKRTNIARDSSRGRQEETIELLGFVNVGQQRAVLVINGLVVSLAEGGSDHGIEVVSIQPPAVVLQRGRQRWQAVLAN